MRIKVTSFIPGKLDLTNEYKVDQPQTIVEFLQTLGVTWDHEALVMVNSSIIQSDYLLQDGDEVHLLIPILGG